jgi:hypothetical protein
MRSASRLAGVSIACGIVWVFTPTALDARVQGGPADAAPPTAIEEALIEHACGALRPAGAPETDAYLSCRQNQLLSLRREFGRDLRRLSNAERSRIDAACNALRATRGQDAYVACLTAQLASLRGHPSRAKPDVAGDAAVPSTAPPSAAPPPTPPSSSRPFGMWIGAALAALIVVGAGGAFAARKSRRALGTCRTCGVTLAERGDLCQNCRHEAAEALRRATAERTDQARAQDDERRRQAAREEEQRQQAARDDEARRRLDEAQKEQARQQEAQAQRQREEEARRQRQANAGAAEDELDPYVVLGLPQDADAAAVEAAYQAARAKYDGDLVDGLSAELQEHFKTKAEAVERAYATIAARRRDFAT